MAYPERTREVIECKIRIWCEVKYDNESRYWKYLQEYLISLREEDIKASNEGEEEFLDFWSEKVWTKICDSSDGVIKDGLKISLVCQDDLTHFTSSKFCISCIRSFWTDGDAGISQYDPDNEGCCNTQF